MTRVAVTYRFENKAEPYLDAVNSVGLEPVSVTPEAPSVSMKDFGALLLTGGTDVDPALYGQAREPRTDEPDLERDALEQRLLREALHFDIPVLAICRGMQLLNVTHPGGTLSQHIEGHAVRSQDPSMPVHDVQVRPGLLESIMGGRKHPVNSRHHQAVARVGEGLIVSACAPDGVVEALERSDRRFALAVQWHPEDQKDSPAQRKLFEAFAASARST